MFYFEVFLRFNLLFDCNKCNLFFCKGYQFVDNVVNVQLYKFGDFVEYEVYIRIFYFGYVNVFIVDIMINKVLGFLLVSWVSGYVVSSKLLVDQIKFSVKILEFGVQCVVVGVCVSLIFYLRGW